MTPSQWRKLSFFDLHVLIGALRENEAEDAFVSIFLVLSLLTGSPAERVLESQLYRSTTDIPRQLDAGALCCVLRERVWVRGVLRPDYAKSARSEWLRYVEATTTKLTFPIPEELMSILVSRLKELPLDFNPGKRRPLFPLRDAPILEAVKRFLSKLNERYKTQFTLLRIQQILFNLLIAGEGDRVEAALITGQMPSTGQAASLYYHWAKKSDLIHTYKEALGGLPAPITFEWSARSGASTLGVGSEICPKTKPLQLLANDLQAAIEIARRNWGHQDAWIDFHNCYIRYVIVMVLFATGHRAVQDPIPYAEDVDWERGLVVINDKSGDHMQKDRLVPLVPTCLLQLEKFVRHRNCILTRMRLLLKTPVRNELPFFFFLSDDLKPQSVQPKTLQDQLSDTYDLPLNINRHLLRSTLRKQGLPGTAVDAFMGHWSDGQNPFDRFSAMDPQVFLSQCSKALETLFSEAGWHVVEGLS
ncbi:MAG: hypothetical protein WEB64_13795 [Marinobacter sp.]